jgi:hypothetical protein
VSPKWTDKALKVAESWTINQKWFFCPSKNYQVTSLGIGIMTLSTAVINFVTQ